MLICSQPLKSQVYRYTSAFSVDVKYETKKKTGEEHHTWNYGKVRKLNRQFVFDLDQKQIDDPGYNLTIPIKEIERDEANKRLVMRVKPIISGIRWVAYIIQFGGDGLTPLYVQKAINYRHDAATDSSLDIYADQLIHVPFTLTSKSMKEDNNLNGSTAKMENLADAKFKDGDNKVWMRSGVVYWTKGSGNSAVTEHFIVDSVVLMDTKMTSGVTLSCHKPGDGPEVEYVISYMYSIAVSPASQWTPRSPIYAVSIIRYQSNKSVSMIIMEKNWL